MSTIINDFDVMLLGAIAIYVMYRWSIETAILNVYLPVLMLLPSSYGMRIPHLPGIDCQGMVLLPIVVALLATRVPGWHFRLSDLLILLFAMEAGYSENLNTGPGNGFFDFIAHVQGLIFPYLLGRIILEQPGFREKFARRLILLVVIAALLSAPEFVTGKNPFYIVGRRFFIESFEWANQGRYGFVRTKGPYAGSIHAGLAFMIAIIMALWLRMVDRYGGDAADPKYWHLRRSTWMLIGLGIGSAMTISRGPWLGMALALVISRVGKSKHIARTAVATAVFCLVGGIFLQTKGKEYTNTSDDSMSETQQSAVYRARAFELYEPIAEKGGYFGWGIATFPRVKGMDSIDNEFLLLRVSQGKLGYWLFLALFAEAGIAVFIAVVRAEYRHDTYFYLSLGGILAGMMLTLSTVYIAGQTGGLLFLLFGWVQSLQKTPPPYGYFDPAYPDRFTFNRVLA